MFQLNTAMKIDFDLVKSIISYYILKWAFSVLFEILFEKVISFVCWTSRFASKHFNSVLGSVETIRSRFFVNYKTRTNIPPNCNCLWEFFCVFMERTAKGEKERAKWKKKNKTTQQERKRKWRSLQRFIDLFDGFVDLVVVVAAAVVSLVITISSFWLKSVSNRSTDCFNDRQVNH